jgi:protein SCO1
MRKVTIAAPDKGGGEEVLRLVWSRRRVLRGSLAHMRDAITLSMFVAAALLSGCTSIQGSTPDVGYAPQDRASVFTYPWVWTDERGERVTFSKWRGGPLVLTAIYTQCRTKCPRTIGKLREIHEAMRREGHAAQFLLVTLDPDGDTPERLRQFKESEGFPDSWHLLAGSVPDTRELADMLGIHVINMDAHLLHNSRILVLDSKGMPARTFGGLMLDDEGPR